MKYPLIRISLFYRSLQFNEKKFGPEQNLNKILNSSDFNYNNY